MHPEFQRGAWFAWDAVLSWINTQDAQSIDKKSLYKAVMQLRPESLEREYNTLQSLGETKNG